MQTLPSLETDASQQIEELQADETVSKMRSKGIPKRSVFCISRL